MQCQSAVPTSNLAALLSYVCFLVRTLLIPANENTEQNYYTNPAHHSYCSRTIDSQLPV